MSTLRLSSQVAPIDLKQDCLELYRAFQGLGCDAKTLIRILAHRTAWQRAEIKKIYESTFKEELCKRLLAELHMKFEKAMLQWMRDPAERDAIVLKDTLNGYQAAKRKTEILLGTFCLRSLEELRGIARTYYLKFGRALYSDVEAATTGLAKKLCVRYLSGFRKVDEGFDQIQAQEEARELYEAGEGSLQLDEGIFVRILANRSNEQLSLIFNIYNKIYQHELHKGLKQCKGKCSEESLETLVFVVKCVSHPDKHFAKVLYTSLKEYFSDEDTVIRVVTSRAEIDMIHIKFEFQRKYKTSLESMISSKITSDNLRQFLLALIGVQ